MIDFKRDSLISAKESCRLGLLAGRCLLGGWIPSGPVDHLQELPSGKSKLLDVGGSRHEKGLIVGGSKMTIFGVDVSFEINLIEIGLAFIALGALWFAWYQIKIMQEDAKTRTQSVGAQELEARAAILLDLDNRWESDSMQAIRAEALQIREEVKLEAATLWPGLSYVERQRRSADIYADKIQKIRQDNLLRYLRLIEICGFFETVGYVAKSGYIPPQDVILLLGGSILTAGEVFKPHIDKRVSETGEHRQLFENFLWLLEETQKIAPG